ncbi:MAG: hypothetical protein HRT73_05405 [Flavobacteriales bacterium]|nr:hypothetical protein [Flavobacteriales bacterium]NQX97304.1 hypothetical protein [Flavobacteriales bacterium]
MHKKIIVLLPCLFFYISIFGCDLCSIYISLDPNGSKNSFGVRYRYRIFEKDYYKESFHLINTNQKRKVLDKHGGSNNQTIKTTEKFTFTETYNSYDVFANLYLNSRLQLNLSTYFSDNYILKDDSISANIAGVGDFSVIVKYKLFNTKKCSVDSLKNKFIHRFTIGGGIDLPTGHYNKSTVTGFETDFKPNVILGTPIEELDPHLQSGTGTFSYLFLMEYMTKFNKFGINTNISYKLSTTNKNEFRFANRFNANGTLFFLTTLSTKIKLMPFIGSSYETSRRDAQNNNDVLGSGGEVLFFNGGINFFINKLSVEFSYYAPIYEDLLDDQAFNKNRMITQLAYYF